MSKYKVGDKVICTRRWRNSSQTIAKYSNMYGTVIESCKDGYRVKIENCPLDVSDWKFEDYEMRFATKLERALE